MLFEAGTELSSAQKSKIGELLEKPGLREKVVTALQNQGIPVDTPCLKLQVLSSSGSLFAIDSEDVRQVLGTFGEIADLRVVEHTVLVLFKEVTSAYFAQKVLQNRHIPTYRAVIHVEWYTSQRPEPEAPTKYTCRFNIQIENDKEFQVARRLIGSKGSHMKKIVEKCLSGSETQAHNIVKLRLRGKGSGFKEGPNKSESEEALHMCISSRYHDKYLLAVSEVEKLIRRVYKEYSDFCISRNLKDPKLKLKKIENVSGKNIISSKRLLELENCKNLAKHEIEELIDIRNEARRQCNFEEADMIREILKKKGISLIDEKGGRGKGREVTTWKASKA